MSLDPFYLIVDNFAQLEPLLPQGVKLAQLRLKNCDDAETRRQIAAARDACRAHGVQLVVNDYWRLALELGCDYVHLGQDDLLTADLDALRAAGIKLGISTHDEAELARALDEKPDYVALGPIFPTRLKQMAFGPQGVEKISVWKQKIGDLPLVAIGGLTPERALDCLRAGAQCAAVVTDISLNPDPVARLREWVATTRAFVAAEKG